MKKIIKQTKDKDIVQITTSDERWYVKPVKDKEGIPEIKFVPSVTWIVSYYPKGIGFMKWLASKGYDEAEAIKEAAGSKGSKVHLAIEDLLSGKKVKMDAKYPNKQTGLEEELKVAEYDCLMAFVDWYNTVKPITIATEAVIFNEEHNYAGTVDYVCAIKEPITVGRTKIEKGIWIIDFKTSQNVWPSHRLQLSAYKPGVIKTDAIHNSLSSLMTMGNEFTLEKAKLGILQLGYRRNKLNYKFTDIPYQFDLFLHTKAIWENECGNVEPAQKDYPITLNLAKVGKSITKKLIK